MASPWTAPRPAPFAGVDRENCLMLNFTDKPKVLQAHKEKRIWPNPMIPWLDVLYRLSNFSFLGIYLSSDAIPPAKPEDYSKAAMHVYRAWTIYYDQIASQGWGTWLIYSTYSNGWNDNNRLPPNLDKVAKNRGKLHGKQIKSILANFMTDCSGSVVYIDNEGGEFPPALATYYKSLFDEMSSGDDAVRPGLYSFAENAVMLFDQYKDLFVDYADLFFWLIPFHSGGTVFPFIADPGQVTFDTKRRLIWNFSQKKNLVLLPVGEQVYTTWEQSMPRSSLPGLTPVKDWDFNCAFVRDPRYPEAYPRFRTINRVTILGVFDKATRSMKLSEGETTLGFSAEPEAPLLLTESFDLFTLDAAGKIVNSHHDTNNKWNPLTLVPDGGVTLRRLRGITSISLANDDVQVFSISRQHKLYGSRRTTVKGKPVWTSPMPFNAISVHPFSAVTSTVGSPPSGSPSSKTSDVFFIDSAKLLHQTRWTADSRGTWPIITHVPIDQTPSLLVGTHLAAISPSPDSQLVFGIDKTRHLRMAVGTKTMVWTPLEAVSKDETELLHPQSKIATWAVDTSTVLVAAFTNMGVPAIYTVKLNGTLWAGAVPQARVLYPRFSTIPDPMDRHFTDAEMVARDGSDSRLMGIGRAWNFNVWGGLELTMQLDQLVLTCAASNADKVGVLKRNVKDTQSQWMVVETGVK